MRSERFRGFIPGFVLGVVLVAGCKPEPHRPDAAPPWWKPAPGQAADWDIQLARTPFDISAPRAMYTIDLWDAVPAATSMDYGDGAPVEVPAGAHAGAIADLHGRALPAIVVCHVGTGAIRLTDPDAKKFPGYEASPPNRPTPIAAGSVIGWSITSADSNERWIDLHDASRSKVLPLIQKRLELALAIGCDAIAANRNDLLGFQGTAETHGFTDVTPGEYASWTTDLTGRAHDLRISIGLRATVNQVVDATPPNTYDWLMTDRCVEGGFECDVAQPFINARKAVFAIEYTVDTNGDTNNPTLLCADLKKKGIADGIVKDGALSSAAYERCP